MSQLTLVIGNKNYSSWSQRPWLVLKHIGVAFNEVYIPLYGDQSKMKILAYSPSGKVPILKDGDIAVWESLAICEYLAEKFPDAQLWPLDPAVRAHARSISHEMHAGFGDLRKNMSMNIRRALPGQGRTAETLRDIARIQAMWEDCLLRHWGPFLFGRFSIADAMYAPVVLRFKTYGVELTEPLRRYADAVLALPAMQAWIAAAHLEKETIEQLEPPSD